MGFGLLFIGYLFMYSFPYHGLDVLPDIIGFTISYIGLKTLAEYGCGFDNLKKYYSVLFPASIITVVVQLLNFFDISSAVSVVWSYAYTALLLLYNILLLVAVYKIADDTDLKSIKAKAKRNLYLGIVYYGVMLFLDFPVKFITELKAFLSANYAVGFVLYIFGYLWMFLNLTLIFNCYMWICKPGDEEMPEKEKRPFFRKDSEEE